MKNVVDILNEDLLYTLDPRNMNKEQFIELLKKHVEVKFVSLVGVDLAGNDTDEKIPIKAFYEDMDEFLNGTVQTDGSSVVLLGIATLNNGRIDIVADRNAKWVVDYNFENIDPETSKPIGTLRIPAFLIHDGEAVDSRSVLARASNRLEKYIMELFKNDYISNYYCINYDEIEKVELTAATELEFWVKTPNDKADIEALSTSQVLQEQYWKRTRGVVRTAMEQSLLFMEKYGLSPEMGHKEVGGVLAQLDGKGNLDHVMEQLEIDWKYSNPMQAADNELYVRILINEIFRKNGLEVCFTAKPIKGVAGNGKHMHIGIALKLKDGRMVNLFTAIDNKKDFISPIGYGSIMGLLNNYEVVSPLISCTIDAFERLQPGFEAPICIAASLGHTVEQPSRNRTVLLGLIRDVESSMPTRFELRAPNPMTNSYITLAAIYQTMIDGIEAVIKEEPTQQALLAELDKDANVQGFYLPINREFRSERDLFLEYTEEERDALFGKPAATVYEAMAAFEQYPKKKAVLMADGVMNDAIINSCAEAAMQRSTFEILNRLLTENMEIVRNCKSLHQAHLAQDMDISNWSKVNELRNKLMKNTHNSKSHFSKLKEAIDKGDRNQISKLQLEMKNEMQKLEQAYKTYKDNLIEI